jgi:hypothetical protein
MKHEKTKGIPGAEWFYGATRIRELKAMAAAWANPKEWLQKALRAAGRDPTEAAAIMAQLADVLRAEIVVKLAAYEEAKRLYAPMVRDGRKDLEIDLALVPFCRASAVFCLRCRRPVVVNEGATSSNHCSQQSGPHLDTATALLRSGRVPGIAPRHPPTPADVRFSHPAVEQSRSVTW